MAPDRQRLARLHRLEKVRAIAKQAAAAEAAQAEGTLSQLLALAKRTGQLVDDYAARRDMTDGSTLRGMIAFREGLAGVSRSTLADAARAQTLADAKLRNLSEAERRRQAVEDRARSEAKALQTYRQQTPLTARKALGTELE